jgi:hypothetical protein
MPHLLSRTCHARHAAPRGRDSLQQQQQQLLQQVHTSGKAADPSGLNIFDSELRHQHIMHKLTWSEEHMRKAGFQHRQRLPQRRQVVAHIASQDQHIIPVLFCRQSVTPAETASLSLC